jgi:NADH-quinone oxidoreductase subunit N
MAGDAMTVTGAMLVTVGLLFKLGAAPAHPWVPDVAEGAPVPAAAFLIVVPKIAAAVALARFVALTPADPEVPSLHLALLAAATLVLGTLAPFRQDDVRRLIGWSSVGQTGNALIGVALVGRVPEALPALLGFDAAYALGNIAAITAVAHLRGRTALADHAVLVRPAPAAALTLAFLSLMGISPLAGFLGKFVLVLEAINGNLA